MCGKRLKAGWLWLVVLLWLFLGTWQVQSEPILVERAELEQILQNVITLETKLIDLEMKHKEEVTTWSKAYETQGILLKTAEDGWRNSSKDLQASKQLNQIMWIAVGVLTAVGGIGWLL